MGSPEDDLRPLTGWGHTAPSTAHLHEVTARRQAAAELARTNGRGVIARGLGRSYGDAAQNAGGLVLDMRALDGIRSVDVDAGLLTADAGVSLEELMRRLLPLGLFVPVTPGTRQVTLGGAIAADIHGKNHHVAGSFGNHVASLDLLTADGEVCTIGPDREAELFWATVGGMGLTGVVLAATVRMTPVRTAYYVVDTERAKDLDELMSRLSADDERYAYSVAWFDSLATGARLGRAVITRGWPAEPEALPAKLRRAPLDFDPKPLLRAPPLFPSGLLNRATVGAFNELWFRKAPKQRRGEILSVEAFHHPLDMVTDWNNVYGPAGFLQYQFVVPFGEEAVFQRCVETIASSGHVSFLNVLKRFGDANPAPLSFPKPGWTLAVDLPVSDGLGALLDSLDELILDADGRTYLAKDSRASAQTVRRMYPELPRWQTIRATVDPRGVFTSDLARRLEL
jgi:decaprenylphospho-beta-D-ribofuranose 2-oxidase